MSLIRILYIFEDVGTYFRALGSLFTDFRAERLFTGDMALLGLSLADYIVAFASVALLIVMGQLGKDTDIRERLLTRPRLVRYVIVLLLVFSTIIFGAYGIGYDAAQFIYNQF